MDEQAVPNSGCGSPRWLCGWPTVALVTDRHLTLQAAGQTLRVAALERDRRAAPDGELM